MTVTTANNTKSGYYDSIARKVFTGERMKMADNIGRNTLNSQGWFFINVMKGAQYSDINIYPDLNADGYLATGSNWGFYVFGGSNFIPNGKWVLRWTDNGSTSQVYISQRDGISFTADTATDILTCGTTAYQDNTVVRVSTTGSLPAGLSADTDYYIVNRSGTQCQLSLTEGGRAVDITSTGSGTHKYHFIRELDDGVDVTANATNDTLEATSHGRQDDQVVRFTTSGTLPGGLSLATDYYIVNATDDDFQVSLSQGGSAVNLTSAGTGTHTATWQNRHEYEVFGNFSAVTTLLRITGDTTAISDLEFLQPGEEARYDAGNMYASAFISDMYGMDTLRTMGFQGTNDSSNRDYADVNVWNLVTWLYSSPPARALAKLAEEVDCNLWICLYHQMTDACIQSWATELDTYWPSGKDVYLEYSNETWNSVSGFYDQYSWVSRGDIASKDVSFNPTTCVITDPSHGLTSGQLIKCFNMRYQRVNQIYSWPFASGATNYAIVDDANTYRFSKYAKDITAITQANPCQVTVSSHGYTTGDTVHIANVSGMTQINGTETTVTVVDADNFTMDGVDSTGYSVYLSGGISLSPRTTANAKLHTIRIKVGDSAIYSTVHDSYAAESILKWDIFKTYFTAGNVYTVCAGQRVQSSVLGHRLTDDMRKNADYTSISCYHRDTEWVTEGTDTGSSASATSCTVSGAGWTTDEFVGDHIVNRDDGLSNGTITSNTSDTIYFTGGLTGGTTNTFNTGDDFRISHFTNATPDEITEWMKSSEGDGTTVLQQQVNNINVSDGIPMINYEGGDANSAVTYYEGGATETELLSNVEWARSSAATDLYYWWAKQLSAVGVKNYAHHVAYGSFSEWNDYKTWGRIEYQGGFDESRKTSGWLEFLKNGGAPKP